MGVNKTFGDYAGLNCADYLFPPKKLSDYIKFAPQKILKEIKNQALKLKGKKILRINATPVGGGVSEMIPYFAALLKDLKVEVHWLTMAPPPKSKIGFCPPDKFFGFTAGLHYALQDSKKKWSVYELKRGKMVPRPVNQADKNLYLEVNNQFAQLILEFQKRIGRVDIVINDDPQCCATALNAKQKGQKWIWRFHPYGDDKSKGWDFLSPHILHHDASMFTIPEYLPLKIRKKIKIFQNYPFIDPYHEKLQPVSLTKIKNVLKEFGIDPKKPILAQISRYDPDKDPIGVIEVFKILKQKYPDLQLVYIGNFASDNPVSVMILNKMKKKITELRFKQKKDVFLLHTQMKHSRPVGFFYQELSVVWHAPNSYIVQLSPREGFGLVVTEAAWCGKPVIGSRVGGIVPQIKHEKTGFLVEPGDYKEVAKRVSQLIENPRLNTKMGKEAKEHIRENFLITSNLLRWLKIINSLV